MQIKTLFATGLMLVVAIAVSAQSPRKLDYGYGLSGSAALVDVDASGNAYVVGIFSGDEDFGPFTLSSNGQEDVYILKINPAGDILNAVSFGGDLDEKVYAIDVDVNGNVHLGGDFTGHVDFDPGSGDVGLEPDLDTDGYLLTLNSDLEYVWVVKVGGFDYDGVMGVSSDASGNVYMTGIFDTDGIIYFTDDGYDIANDHRSAFFAKMDADGGKIWYQTLGNDNDVAGSGITVDAAGAPVFIGTYNGTVDLNTGSGTQNVTAAGVNDIYILKLAASNGNFVWGKSIGADSENYSRSISADPQNNVYVAGYFAGTGDFDPGSAVKNLTSNGGGYDIFVTKLNSSGNLSWTTSFGGESDDFGYDVFATASDVYVAGMFGEAVNFGGTELYDGDNTNGFVLDLDNNGNFKWVGDLGGEDGNDGALDVAGSGGNVYLVGSVGSSDNDVDPSCRSLYVDYEQLFSYILKIGTQSAGCTAITSQPISADVCAGATVTLEVAATGTDLSYQWMQYSVEGYFDLSDQDGYFSGATTSKLTVTTGPFGQGEGLYQVRVSAPSMSDVYSDEATIAIGAHEPFIQDVVNCGAGVITLKALGAEPGQYRWYASETSSAPIPGANVGTYKTPILNTTKDYWVAVDDGTCQSTRVKLTAWITACEPSPALKWAQGFGGPSTDGGGEMIMLKDGNILIPGAFIGTIDIDPGPGVTTLTAADGGQDGFLLKMTPDREVIWVKQFTGNTSTPSPSFVREDAAGNIYLAGTVTGFATDFDAGAGTLAIAGQSGANNLPDSYLVKFDKDGNALWGKKFGNDPYFDGMAGLEIAADGEYISGYFWNTFKYDGVNKITSVGGTDIYVMKIDPSGNLVWLKQLGNSYANGNAQTENPTAIFLKGNDLYIGARVAYAPLDVDPDAGTVNITAGANGDAFVLKLDTDGKYQSVFKYESSDGGSNVADILVDDNNIYVSGSFVGTNDFDPETGVFDITSTGGISASPALNGYIAKHSLDGILVWAKALHVSNLNSSSGGDITIAANGDIVVSGTYQGSVDFDPGPLEYILHGNSLFLNSYLLKLNSAGEFNWVVNLRRVDNVSSSGAGGNHWVDSNGDIFMQGSLSGSIDFDPQDCTYEVNAVGATDFYLWRLSFDVANICFDVMPADLQTCAGDDIFLNASAVGATGITYQWQIQDPNTGEFADINDGDDYKGAQEKQLTIDSKNGFGAGLYRVIASAPKAEDRISDVANLMYMGTTPDAPTATDAATCLTSASLALTASGGSDGAYRWYSDGVPDPSQYDGTYQTPVLNASQTYYVSIVEGYCESKQTPVVVTIDVANSAPVVEDVKVCGVGDVTLKASGAPEGNYRWYTSAVSSPIAGQTNSTFTAQDVDIASIYYVSIALPDCEGPRQPVNIDIGVPTTPAVKGKTECLDTPDPVELAVPDLLGDIYWYSDTTDESLMYVGPVLTTDGLVATTTFYVSEVVNECESDRKAVTITMVDCSNNQPPVIAATTQTTVIGGKVTISLSELLSDPDNNIDTTTLKIINQPPSGAVTTINENYELVVDYAGLTFAGEDQLTIEVCDIAATCVQQVIRIIVAGDVVVYNAVSPNGDGKNDVFYLEFIDILDATKSNKVKIYNRWGDLVFSVSNYDNTTNVFAGKNNNGNDLPAGTYYYRIEFPDGRKAETGYLSLKR